MSQYNASYLGVLRATICDVEKTKTYTNREMNFLHWRFTIYPENYTPSDDFTEILDCYSKYINIILKYSERNDFKSSKIYKANISKYMNAIADIGSIPGLADRMVEHITSPILEHVSDPSIKTTCAKELIRSYNTIIKNCDKSLKEKITNSGSLIHLYKLADILCSCGDYEYQSSLLETIFRLCPSNLIGTQAAEFFPGAESLQQALVKVDIKDFDNAIRQFLIVANTLFGNVYSFIAADILLDDINVLPPLDPHGDRQKLWIDFNRLAGTIGIYCDHICLGSDPLSLEEYNGWELITIFAKDVGSVEIKKPKDKDKENKRLTLFKFTLINPFYVNYLSSEKASASKYLRVVTYDQKVVEELQSSVLPTMFPEKFHGPRNQRNKFMVNDSSSLEVVPFKGCYKPLSVTRSMRSRSITSMGTRSMKSLDDTLAVLNVINEPKNVVVSAKCVSANLPVLDISVDSTDCIPESQYFSAEEYVGTSSKQRSPCKEKQVIRQSPQSEGENVHGSVLRNKSKAALSKKQFKVKFPYIRRQILPERKSLDQLFSPIYERVETSAGEHIPCGFKPPESDINNRNFKELPNENQHTTESNIKEINIAIAAHDEKLIDIESANQLLNITKTYVGRRKGTFESSKIGEENITDSDKFQMKCHDILSKSNQMNDESLMYKSQSIRNQENPADRNPGSTFPSTAEAMDDACEYFTALYDELDDVVNQPEPEEIQDSQRSLTSNTKAFNQEIYSKGTNVPTVCDVIEIDASDAEQEEDAEINYPTVFTSVERTMSLIPFEDISEDNSNFQGSVEEAEGTALGETNGKITSRDEIIKSPSNKNINLCKTTIAQKLCDEEIVSSQKSAKSLTCSGKKQIRTQEIIQIQKRNTTTSDQQIDLKGANSSLTVGQDIISEVLKIDASDMEDDTEFTAQQSNKINKEKHLLPDEENFETDLNRNDSEHPEINKNKDKLSDSDDLTFVDEDLLEQQEENKTAVIKQDVPINKYSEENKIRNEDSSLRKIRKESVIDLTYLSNGEIDDLEEIENDTGLSPNINNVELTNPTILKSDSDMSSQVISGVNTFKIKERKRNRSRIIRSRISTKQDEVNCDNRNNTNSKHDKNKQKESSDNADTEVDANVDKNEQKVNNRIEATIPHRENIDEYIEKQNSLFDDFLTTSVNNSNHQEELVETIERIIEKSKFASQLSNNIKLSFPQNEKHTNNKEIDQFDNNLERIRLPKQGSSEHVLENRKSPELLKGVENAEPKIGQEVESVERRGSRENLNIHLDNRLQKDNENINQNPKTSKSCVQEKSNYYESKAEMEEQSEVISSTRKRRGRKKKDKQRNISVDEIDICNKENSSLLNNINTVTNADQFIVWQSSQSAAKKRRRNKVNLGQGISKNSNLVESSNRRSLRKRTLCNYTSDLDDYDFEDIKTIIGNPKKKRLNKDKNDNIQTSDPIKSNKREADEMLQKLTTEADENIKPQKRKRGTFLRKSEAASPHPDFLVESSDDLDDKSDLKKMSLIKKIYGSNKINKKHPVESKIEKVSNNTKEDVSDAVVHLRSQEIQQSPNVSPLLAEKNNVYEFENTVQDEIRSEDMPRNQLKQKTQTSENEYLNNNEVFENVTENGDEIITSQKYNNVDDTKANIQKENEDISKTMDAFLDKETSSIFEVNTEKILSQKSECSNRKQKMSQSDSVLVLKKPTVKRLKLYDPNDLTHLENDTEHSLICPSEKNRKNETRYERIKQVLDQSKTIKKKETGRDIKNTSRIDRSNDTLSEEMGDENTIGLSRDDDLFPNQILDGNKNLLTNDPKEPYCVLERSHSGEINHEVLRTYEIDKITSHISSSSNAKRYERRISTSSSSESEDEPPKHFTVAALVHSISKKTEKRRHSNTNFKNPIRDVHNVDVDDSNKISKIQISKTTEKRGRKRKTIDKHSSPIATKADHNQIYLFETFLNSFQEDMNKNTTKRITKIRNHSSSSKVNRLVKKTVRSKGKLIDNASNCDDQPEKKKQSKVKILEDIRLDFGVEAFNIVGDFPKNSAAPLGTVLDIVNGGADCECPESVWKEMVKILHNVADVTQQIEHFVTQHAPSHLKDSDEYKKILFQCRKVL